MNLLVIPETSVKIQNSIPACVVVSSEYLRKLLYIW